MDSIKKGQFWVDSSQEIWILVLKVKQLLQYSCATMINRRVELFGKKLSYLNLTVPFIIIFSGDSRLLPELFSTVVDQFHLVVDCFRIMLRCINMSVDRNQCESVKFDIADVWARIQSVMQMMLTDYLDFKSKNSLSMQG